MYIANIKSKRNQKERRFILVSGKNRAPINKPESQIK